MDKRKCCTCKEEKTVNLFYPSKHTPSGYTRECNDCIKRRSSEWQKLRKDHRKKYLAERYQRQKETIKSRVAKWKKENKESVSASNAKRRRRVIEGIESSSLVKTVVKSFYSFSRDLELITGKKHHVDHVIPLSKGGLHVPWNLQVITATENLKKGSSLV